MLRHLVETKRDSVAASDKVDYLIDQVRDMSFRQDQIRGDLKESLRYAETFLQRCQAYREKAD